MLAPEASPSGPSRFEPNRISVAGKNCNLVERGYESHPQQSLYVGPLRRPPRGAPAGREPHLLQVGLGETGKVTRMLRQLMPLTIAFAYAQLRDGADAVVLADHATGNLVGPYHYRDLLLPLHREIEARIGEATAAGMEPAAVMNDGLIAAMDEVGRRYGAGEIFGPEMLVSAYTRGRFPGGRPRRRRLRQRCRGRRGNGQTVRGSLNQPAGCSQLSSTRAG